MDVYIIGSGTAIPAEGHSPAGIVVMDQDIPILLDIGPGTLSRLHLAKLSYDHLDTLLLSHLHPDHTLDLGTLLQVFDSAPNTQRTRPFAIYGCRGIKEFIERMYALYPAIRPQTYPVVIKEVYQDDFTLSNLQIKTAPSGHTDKSIAYRIHNGRSSLVYSGDASDQGELVKLAKGTELFICECSFPEGWETADHLNAEKTGRIAQQAGVQKLVITHRYPPALSVDLASQIRNYYNGELILASDGLHLSL